MTPTNFTGARIIAEKLSQAGCRHAFGIPGGEVLAILDGLKSVGIDFHLTKHENAAGFMAEGAYHAEHAGNTDHRAPAVLIATIGPGAANAVNVVANAMQDRVPLIFLTGCVDAHEAETYTHQVFDHQAMLRPIVKASFRASHGTIGVMMEKALAIAFEGQPGPVHIDVPIGVAESMSDEKILPLASQPAPSMVGIGETLASAITALNEAKRPLVIAGVDAVEQQVGSELTRFCEKFSLPLITTYKGKGLMREDHPLCLGGHGLSPKSDRLLMPLIEQADTILLVGYDPIEMRTGWRNPWNDQARVVEITPALRTHGMHRAGVTLMGSIAPVLAQLSHAVEAGNVWPDKEPEQVRGALNAAFAPPDQWGPGQVFATLNAGLPADTVITADSGAHRILLSQMWTASAPEAFLQSTALCTMGCAVPLAAGYKLAKPQTPVCAFVGDAGLEMCLGELATVRDMRQPLIICVLVDESLALIELKQRNTQRANFGVDFPGTDFVGVANAMGGVGLWIDDSETLREAIDDALTRDTFTLFACRIDRKAYDGAF